MKRGAAFALGAALFVAAAAGATSLSAARASPVTGVPLVDQRGVRFTLGAFAGKRLLVGFATASEGAAGACASISGKFAYLQRRIDPARVHLVQLSADPLNDSAPGVLGAYARTYGIDPSRWTVASGPEPGMSAADSTLIAAARQAQIGDVFGSAVAVFDERGRLRAMLDAGALTPDGLVRAALQR